MAWHLLVVCPGEPYTQSLHQFQGRPCLNCFDGYQVNVGQICQMIYFESTLSLLCVSSPHLILFPFSINGTWISSGWFFPWISPPFFLSCTGHRRAGGSLECHCGCSLAEWDDQWDARDATPLRVPSVNCKRCGV